MEVFLEHWKNFEPQICIWNSKTNDFIESLRTNFKIEISPSYSLLDAFVNRFEKNRELEELLWNLSKYYRFGLLTNMYPDMFVWIEKKWILPKYNWATIIDSSVVWYKKPEEAIYALAEQKAWVHSSALMFIDNKEENLLIPKERWWKTLLYNPREPKQSNTLLRNYLL
jgi:FMN phosphatase YigB (HAD superfamily)